MYARGLTIRQISDKIEDIYGFEVSESMVSNITNKLLPEIEAWQQKPLSSIYPIIFIDAVYVILSINEEGRKEVLSREMLYLELLILKMVICQNNSVTEGILKTSSLF